MPPKCLGDDYRAITCTSPLAMRAYVAKPQELMLLVRIDVSVVLKYQFIYVHTGVVLVMCTTTNREWPISITNSKDTNVLDLATLSMPCALAPRVGCVYYT
jgi:hypothetical protein